MNITPFTRTPFTDLFSHFVTFQRHPECGPYEMRVVDCMEAYGVPRGREKCRLLLDDFRECVVGSKQMTRCEIMHIERIRQYRAGERKELYAEDPVVDSY